MTIDEFTDWAQEKFDSCNIHNEMEANKVIVEVMNRFHSLNKEEIQEPVKEGAIVR